MVSRTFKIQQPRVVWDDLTFHCHQITIFTCTRSNQGHFLDNWRSNWRSNTISLKMEQWRQVGCRFRVFQAAWLISGIKNHVLFTGGHLGMKSGGQSDLHFDILDIMRNIVKWGGYESGNLENPKNDTPLDYVAHNIQNIKMEVTLTSTFHALRQNYSYLCKFVNSRYTCMIHMISYRCSWYYTDVKIH